MKITKVTMSPERLEQYRNQNYTHRKNRVVSGFKKIVVATDADLD